MHLKLCILKNEVNQLLEMELYICNNGMDQLFQDEVVQLLEIEMDQLLEMSRL